MAIPIFTIFWTAVIFVILLHENTVRSAGRGRPIIAEYVRCSKTSQCPQNQKCMNWRCINACANVTCNSLEMCVPIGEHQVLCECMPGFVRETTACKMRCYHDSHCNLNQECVITGEIGHCVCLPGFVHDLYYPQECRYLCSNDDDCAEGSVCSQGLCIDFCDSWRCPLNYLCLTSGRTYLCLTADMIKYMYSYDVTKV